MKLILSRKGFDSSAGGVPSPILPDGRMISLPIPDKQSPISYSDIKHDEVRIAQIVNDLTGGRIPPRYRAHLDPDLLPGSLNRQPEWRPLLGQTGAAQGHLRKNGIKSGDLFLFFGLFRRVRIAEGKYIWDREDNPRHIIWGWLQVGDVVPLDGSHLRDYEWAKYHPHFHRDNELNNTLYVASQHLCICDNCLHGIPGAGTFPCVSPDRELTSASAEKPSIWKLPDWFYPMAGRAPLTYHSKPDRWHRYGNRTILHAVGRGQEFILDCEHYPEAIPWLYQLLNAIE